ncbi:MAG: hypothetical protein AB7S38_42100 [Vulcanimicrobiota bacterium]
MTRKITLFFSLALFLAAPVWADNVALLREAKGEVKVDGKPARRYQALAAGSKLTLAAGAYIRVDYLKKGSRQEVTGPADVSVTAAGLEAKGATVKKESASQVSLMPQVGAQGKAAAGITRALNEGLEDVTVRLSWKGQTPIFHMIKLDEVTEGPYEVSVFDPDNRAKPLWADYNVEGDQVAYAGPPLAVDKDYLVVAIPSNPARSDSGELGIPFRVLSAEDQKMIEDSKRDLSELAKDSSDPTPRLLLLRLLEEHSLYYDASLVADALLPQAENLDPELREYFYKSAWRVYKGAQRGKMAVELGSKANPQ